MKSIGVVIRGDTHPLTSHDAPPEEQRKKAGARSRPPPRGASTKLAVTKKEECQACTQTQHADRASKRPYFVGFRAEPVGGVLCRSGREASGVARGFFGPPDAIGVPTLSSGGVGAPAPLVW